MTSDLRIQGEVVVNSEQAESAFNRVGDKAQQMATEVATSATKAGQAVDKIGDGAGASAEKFTRAESRISASIKRATNELELLGKTASQRLEFNISDKGLDPKKFEPMLQRLREVEAQAQAAQRAASGSLDKMGISAAQTAAALRGVPAQFTDIVTSLQGGQAPLTVFLQQGGQLKDMFGGAGNAARALGGYVVGLINPLTVAAAAGVALAIAYKQGSAEADAYNKALITTGNAAGTNAAQLKTYAAQISAVVGTQGAAAESLAALAATGKIGADSLKEAALAAVQYERATGQAVKKTAEQFASLGAEPLSAVLKLNEGMNFLTVSTYRQIKSLEEQGRIAEATATAQRAFADALSMRSSAITQNLGYIEAAWRGVADAAKRGWDAMLNVGRSSTSQDALGVLRADLSRRQEEIRQKRAINPNADTSGLDRGLDILKQRIGLLESDERQTRRLAAAEAERVELSKSLFQFEKEGDQFKQKSAKKAEEIAKAEIEGRKLILAGLLTEKELRQRIADIKEKYKESGAAGTGENEVAAILAKNAQRIAYLGNLRAQISGARPLSDDVKPTANEELAAKIQKELETSIKGVARAQKEKALAAAQAGIQTDKDILAAEKQKKALVDLQSIQDKQIDAVQKQADSIRDQAIGQENVNANFGKSKTAIEQATLAQLKLQQAEAESSDRFAPAYVAALEAKTLAQKRFVESLQKAEYLQTSQKLAESNRASKEETATLNLQLSLLGRTQLEREKIIAQRQVEVKLAKELADIEKLNLGDGPEAEAKRIELRAQATANAAIDSSNAASKVVLADWERTAESIERSLTDALLRGFESGKDFAKNLRDTVVNMFKTLVLRPIISAVINPVAGVITGALGTAGVASAATGGASALGTIGNAASGLSALTGTFGMGLRAGLSGLFGEAGLAGTISAGTTAIGAGNIAGGLGTLAGPLALVGGGLLVLNSLLKSTKGETRTGGQFGVSFDGTVTNQRRGQTYTYQGQQFDRDFSNGQRNALIAGQAYRLEGDPVQNEQAIRDAVSGTASGINAFLKALGSKATLTGFSAGLETSSKGRGGVFAGGILSDGTTFGESGKGDNYAGTLYEKFSTNSPDFKTALENFTLDLKQSTIQALQSVTDIPETVKKMLKGVDAEGLSEEAANALLESINAQIVGVQNLTNSFEAMGLDKLAKMGFDAAAGLAAAAGGFDKLQSNLNTYYDNFYSEEERKANLQKQVDKQFAELGIDVPKNRDEFRKLVEDTLAQVEVQDKAKASLSKQISDAVLSAGEGKFNLSDLSGRSIISGIDPALLGNAAADPAVAGKLNGFLSGLSDLAGKGFDAATFDKGLSDLINLNSEVLGIGKDADKTAAALLGLSGTFAQLNNSAEDAAAAIKKQQDEVYNLFQRALARDRDALNEQASVLQDAISGISDAVDLLRSNARELYGTVDSTQQMLAAQGMVYIEQALAGVRAGASVADYTGLSDAISAARSGVDRGRYTSEFERQRDTLVLAGQLSQLADSGELQLSFEERQLKAINEQLDYLNKLDKRAEELVNGTAELTGTVQGYFDQLLAILNPVKPDAAEEPGASGGGFSSGPSGGTTPPPNRSALVRGLADGADINTEAGLRDLAINASIKGVTQADFAREYGYTLEDIQRIFDTRGIPRFDVGTNYVPRDMLAQIHEGEAIVPKAYNPAANPSMGGGNAELLAEVRALREAVAALQAAASATAGNTQLMPQMARQIDTYTNGGVFSRNKALV